MLECQLQCLLCIHVFILQTNKNGRRSARFKY
jgi:hypothetical protein